MPTDETTIPPTNETTPPPAKKHLLTRREWAALRTKPQPAPAPPK
jgi:hypothetical protein